MNTRQLNADGLKVRAIERAINDVAAQVGARNGIPLNINVPVAAGGTNILRRRKRREGCRNIIVNANLIQNQNVGDAVRAALQKCDALQLLGAKLVNGSGTKRRERDLNLHPATCRDVSGKLAERQGFREAARVLRDAKSFARIGEHNAGEIRGGHGLWSE